MVIREKLLLSLFLLLGGITCSFAQVDAEHKKIDYLIAEIANLHEAKFVRNGKEYGADEAVDHLRMKLRYAGDRIKTAEQFITYCATSSSTTGQKYLIRFADGRTIDAAAFLRERLARYRSS